MSREPELSTLPYVFWFLAAFLVTACVGGLIEMLLPRSELLQFIIGIVVVFASAEFARSRFRRNTGRALRGGERVRLLIGSEIVVFLITAVSMLVIIRAINSRYFYLGSISPSRAFFIAISGVAFYFPVLWACYWWLNGQAAAKDEPETKSGPSSLRVLVLGGGGREHALAWKLAQSHRVFEVVVAPGNAGTARERKCRNVPADLSDINGLVQLARRENISLTVVGPEAPLVAGVVDRFRSEGLRIFGPTAKAAQLEGSKAFAKDFLARHKIPTAHYAVFTELDAALAHLHEVGAPIVVKADGLAAGKGVIVATTLEEAEAAVRDMLAGNAFGTAGSRVVIEEFLEGEEASFITIVDGRTALPMATSQDHKRVHDGDTGPNTGGMGAYSPAPVVTSAVHERVMREIVEPTVRGMAADGMPFTGFLYAGLMIDKSGAAKVIEFNVRFGDPETQPVMLRLQSDLLELIDTAVDGQLRGVEAEWNALPSLGVVMAAANYPDTPRLGDVISGIGAAQSLTSKVFHGGTRLDAVGQVVTSGGRVLCVCALGDSVADAQREAYSVVAKISWDGEFHRTDIGWRAIARERSAG